jgi:putative lipoprotein
VKRVVLGTAALVAVLALPRSARADDDPDPWLGPDKALHFTASGVLALGGYAIGTVLVDSQAGALLIGGAFSLTAGIAKESLDLAGLGHPSWKDMAWNGIGIVTGLAVGWTISLIVRSASRKPAAALSPSYVLTF